jgi:DsbC/DsbD-like thiol-disulfide interchange protein
MNRFLLIPALAAVISAAPAEADQPGFGSWSGSDQARVRLIAAGVGEDGQLSGGIEIMLQPGWWTYWRTPGAAGIPPVVDFAGSGNLGDVTVSYPLPQRHDDGYGVSNVYADGVLLPFKAAVPDTSAPVELKLALALGVCSEVCIPTSAKADVTSSSEPDPLSTARIESFEPRVPRAPEPGRSDIEAVTVEENALLIDARMPESSYLDLFADPPAGWYIGQPALVERTGGISRYRLSLAGRPADAKIEGQIFTFVAVSGGEAIEKAVEIR